MEISAPDISDMLLGIGIPILVVLKEHDLRGQPCWDPPVHLIAGLHEGLRQLYLR